MPRTLQARQKERSEDVILGILYNDKDRVVRGVQALGTRAYTEHFTFDTSGDDCGDGYHYCDWQLLDFEHDKDDIYEAFERIYEGSDHTSFGIAYDAALKRGCDPEILALLKPPETMQPDRENKLLKAATRGDRDEVAHLLGAGVFVDAGDSNCGRTPLMAAARHGRLTSLQTLLKHRADPDLQGPCKWTALMLAAMHGNPQCLRALLEAGADTTIRSTYNFDARGIVSVGGTSSIPYPDGRTALDYAKDGGHAECVAILQA